MYKLIIFYLFRCYYRKIRNEWCDFCATFGDLFTIHYAMSLIVIVYHTLCHASHCHCLPYIMPCLSLSLFTIHYAMPLIVICVVKFVLIRPVIDLRYVNVLIHFLTYSVYALLSDYFTRWMNVTFQISVCKNDLYSSLNDSWMLTIIDWLDLSIYLYIDLLILLLGPCTDQRVILESEPSKERNRVSK